MVRDQGAAAGRGELNLYDELLDLVTGQAHGYPP